MSLNLSLNTFFYRLKYVLCKRKFHNYLIYLDLVLQHVFFTLKTLFIDAHSGKLGTHTHFKILTRFDLYFFISSYFGAERLMFFPVDSRVSEGADPLK